MSGPPLELLLQNLSSSDAAARERAVNLLRTPKYLSQLRIRASAPSGGQRYQSVLEGLQKDRYFSVVPKRRNAETLNPLELLTIANDLNSESHETRLLAVEQLVVQGRRHNLQFAWSQLHRPGVYASAVRSLRAMVYGQLREKTNGFTDELESLFFAPLRRFDLAMSLKAIRRRRLDVLEVLESFGDRVGLIEALVDRDPEVRVAAARSLWRMAKLPLAKLFEGNSDDLRRLAESDEPDRIRLLIIARDLGAELPAEARELLQEVQGGAFSLGDNGSAGAVTLSDEATPGALSLPPKKES